MTNKSIILVEDDDDIRNDLATIIGELGYEVLPAAHGEEALEILKEKSNLGVIILDMMMPIMNGWEFLEERKKDSKAKTIPVIVLSALGDNANLGDEGPIEYLNKPINLDLLCTHIKKFCCP